MGNIVDIQVTGDKVILRVPDKNIVTEIDNVVSFDSKSKKLISTGVKEEDFKIKYPKKWRKYKERLHFRPIFVIEAFSPETAAMFLWGWWNTVSRQVIPATTVFRWQVKPEISISFERYEALPFHHQQEFEYLVFRYLYAGKLCINQNEIQREKRKSPPVLLLPILSYIFGMGLLLLGLIPVITLMIWASMLGLPSILDFLLFVLIVLGGLSGFVLLGDFISKYSVN